MSQLTHSQEKVSKTLNESFTLNSSGTLSLDNKYGDVRLYGWDKNKVDITVEVIVTHKKKEVAENLLTRVASVVVQANNAVNIHSEITKKESNFFSKYFNKANPFAFDGSNVQINYTIYLPKDTEIMVTNRFGSVFIENWNGTLRAVVQHGDLWIQQHLSNADIDLKYGKLRATSFDYANILVKNGALDIETAKGLKINSSGSNLKIDHVNTLELYASRDDIRIGSVSSISGDLKFSTLAVNSLDQKAAMSMKIADFSIHQIRNAAADLNLTQESSEISLNIANFSFKFNATVEEGLVRIPKSFKNIETRMLDEGKRIRKITATYGESTKGSITISGTKGVVLLKEL